MKQSISTHTPRQWRHYTIIFSLLWLLGIIWGSGYTLAKLAMTNGAPALGYSFWQSLGPALLLLLFMKIRGIRLPLTHRHLVYYLICGSIGLAIPNTNMYFAAPHLPAGLLALLVNTVPIIIYPIALLVKLERFRWLRIAGLIFGVLGLACVFIPQTNLPEAGQLPWAFMTMLTPLLFAIVAVYIAARRPDEGDSLALATGMLIFSTFFLAPVVFATDNFYTLMPPFNFVDWIIILEIILSSIGYVILFELLKRAGPVYYSLVSGVVVITGLFWGYIIFGETLNIWIVTAVSLILLAIFLVTVSQEKHDG